MARTSAMDAPIAKLNNVPRWSAESSSALVSRLSSQVPRGSRHDRESFSQLLQGLLGTGGTQMSEGIVIEDDVNVNYSLINVIIEAGLDLSHLDDPFVPAEAVNRQICDSLAVIDLVVKRTPKVLFIENKADSNSDHNPEHATPMFVCLIPKLFPLLGEQQDQGIEVQACKLLSSMVEAQNRCSQSRQNCASISDFLQFCADDLLVSVENTLKPIKQAGSTTEVFFPGQAADISTLLRKTNLGGRLTLKPFRVGGPQHALNVILAIHDAVVTQLSTRAKSVFGTSIRRDLSVSLDSLGRLWKLLLHGIEAQKITDACASVLIPLYLGLLLKASSSISSLKQKLSLSQRASLMLAQCVVDILCSGWIDSDLELQVIISSRLTRIFNASLAISELSKAVEDVLVPILATLKLENRHFVPELQTVLDHFSANGVDFFKAAYDPRDERPTQDQKSSMNQERLGEENDVQMSDVPRYRPRKRLRLSRGEGEKPEPKSALLDPILHHICLLLGSRKVNDVQELSKLISARYEAISKDKQCEMLQYLGRIACAGTGTIGGQLSASVGVSNFECTNCDVPGAEIAKDTTQDDAQNDELYHAFSSLLSLRAFQECPEARVIAMLTLRRFALHCPSQNNGIAGTAYGDWCVQSLKSSVRELRIIAGRTLASFLHEGFHDNVRRQNRIYALEALQNLLRGADIPVLETTVLALGEVAQVCGDDEMNIILIRLVEYLGHENPYLSSLAFNQLLKLAHSGRDTPAGLLRPFWRTIAVTVVKNLLTRPQIAQQLSEFLGMNIPDLLVLTEAHTLPYLVLSKNVEIVRRIALAHRPPVTTKALLLHDENLPAILALLLMQLSSDYESTITSLLREFAPDVDDPLHKLVGNSTIRVACEILKAAGDAQEGKGSKAHQALRVLPSLASTAASKKSENLGQFFETNVLGIIKEFADTINEVQIRQPLTEKRRCLKATAAMVKLGKGQIASALPQISACLRSAMEIQELCDTAFHAWSELIFALVNDDIEPLIDQTFSIIARNWDSFPNDTRDLAHRTVSHIFNHHGELLSDLADSIPSLRTIPELALFEEEIIKLKDGADVRHQLQAFVHRCQSDNVTVVLQSLTELVSHLKNNQEFLHQPSINESPDPVVAQLTRAVLDCCIKFSSDIRDIALLCAKCLGLIGCLDPNRIEASRTKKDIMIVSNFGKADETIEFILFFLQEILVDAFLSAPNTRAQGFLAFAMQELLKLCELDASVLFASGDAHSNVNYRRWLDLPELVRNTLTPFLNSRYVLQRVNVNSNKCSYPLFQVGMSHYEWLQKIVLDLLQKANGENVELLFEICSRIIRFQDSSILTFLLPFATLNVIVSGTETERAELISEFLYILQFELPEDRQIRDSVISCSESIFATLDYLSRWRQENKRRYVNVKLPLAHGRSNVDLHQEIYAAQLASVEEVLNSIPADVTSKRAVECKSFARALFHWEQYIRQQKDNARARDDPKDLDPYFERLQEIYSQIDEPDGIEGISAQLHLPDVEQQILEHQKAGRWMTAQSWYEIRLNENPDNVEVQLNLLKCLKASGQYDGIMSQIDSSRTRPGFFKSLPFAVEASWITSRWDKLEEYIRTSTSSGLNDFNVKLGSALLFLKNRDPDHFLKAIRDLQLELGKGLTTSSTSSLQSCHDTLLKLHILEDMETLLGAASEVPANRQNIHYALNRRLEVLGGHVSDKQYVLGLRRAVMQLPPGFPPDEIASAWITSAKLARKSNADNQAVNAVLRASRLGSPEATIENARLLWKEGHHRKATKTLDGLLATHSFADLNMTSFGEVNDNTASMTQNKRQKLSAAKAQLLLAKWLDHAGQTSQEQISERYRDAIKLHRKWEKGHFSLGKYYNKLLDSEKSKPPDRRADAYMSGEVNKLVIDNYIRSMPYGFKYIFRTLPKILTLWLDLASSADQPNDLKHGDEKFQLSVMTRRRKILEQVNAQIKKYMEKIPPCSLFTSLPQLVARICHSNTGVQGVLTSLIVKIICNFPQQALWSLIAVSKSSSKERAVRGKECLRKVQEHARRTKPVSSSIDLKALVASGHRLSDELLRICEADIHGKPSRMSLARDLNFNHKLAPCKLVVPLETTLTPSLPPNLEQNEMANHAAFPQDTITINAFLDDVLILSSLQKPRKLNARGSDGRVYGLLCKPKDDLRKDQRLMEFNTMINRFLKRDDESSKRKLYIKTYAVTPLNEECGIIEWVDNLKTLRDILLKMYRERNVSINYTDIRTLLDEACYDKSKLHIFADKVLARFRPVFFEWFIEMFPEPEQWFTARLRYTRSCAVMSMVGHVLGLGDRHGENILFQEDSGGTLHVDFNCLFDKGLTFEKPELVPFRLTHNMVDAFGAYGYDGPFRRSCQLSMGLLRQNEDALMTILETFLYDPTTDFIGKKKRQHANVPDTPAGVLQSVRSKLRGMLPQESVPLSVSGHVDHLIRQAVDPKNLAAMYIGWCAFF